MACSKNNAPLFAAPNTGRSTTMSVGGTLAHLNKHGCSIGRTHDEINFATPTPGRTIIARYQAQALRGKIVQRGVFRRIAHLLGGAQWPL